MGERGRVCEGGGPRQTDRRTGDFLSSRYSEAGLWSSLVLVLAKHLASTLNSGQVCSLLFVHISAPAHGVFAGVR